MKEGAVIAFERNGGAACIDELYAIYPDGRIVGDNGTAANREAGNPRRSTRIDSLLLSTQRWFTDNMYSTSHLPCGVCYHYFTTVAYEGQEKDSGSC